MTTLERLQQINVMITQHDVYQIIPISKTVNINWNRKNQKLIQKQYNKLNLLSRAEGATMFFIIEEAKESVLDFSKGTVKVV